MGWSSWQRQIGGTGVGLALLIAAACDSSVPRPSASPVATSATAPSATPTASPSPTPTPVPTPLPSLPAVGASAFPAGWTVAARATNVGDDPGTTLRSTIGSSFSVVAVCTGEGAMTVTLRASGGPIKDAAGIDAGTIPLDCPAVDPTPQRFEFTAAKDWHGVLIDPIVSAPAGVTYTVLVGTHG